MTHHLFMILLLSLAACQPPRSEAYFKANPEESIEVDARCRAGTQRGEECANAQAGVTEAAYRARAKMFRRGFEK